MSTAAHYPHISLDEGGVARIDGTRYKVLHLAGEHHHYGWSAEELLRQHPDLRPEQVYAALAYFYDHYEALLGKLEATAVVAEKLRHGQTLSRDELLNRKPTGAS